MAKETVQAGKLFWLDLEMTGFDTSADLIVEVAVVVTDFNLRVLDEYQSGVYQDEAVLRKRWQKNPWFAQQSKNYRAAILQSSQQGQASNVVERELVALVKKHAGGQPMFLAGNSVYVDRGFLASYWSSLNSLLHYRLLDVSAFKVCLQSRGLFFEKAEQHRALDDVRESIAELKFYLKHFKT